MRPRGDVLELAASLVVLLAANPEASLVVLLVADLVAGPVADLVRVVVVLPVLDGLSDHEQLVAPMLPSVVVLSVVEVLGVVVPRGVVVDPNVNLVKQFSINHVICHVMIL